MNLIPPGPESAIEYPESDGKPMADNTKQGRWIVILFGNLAALFREAADVFVAVNLLWYPLEGEREIRNAPDVLLVFGRPKGDRPSYRQWEEGEVPVTVVFEILSPSNTVLEMDQKLLFYEDHGAEEYYVYDPERNYLMAYVRHGEVFRRVRPVQGFVSPRLGIRFDLSGPELAVFRPDGRPFLTFEQLDEARERAEQRADTAEQRADRAERQMARLRELSRKARQGQANPDELQELDLLEQPPAP